MPLYNPANIDQMEGVQSGHYTPVMSIPQNLANLTAEDAFYARIGPLVSVNMRFSITATAAGACSFRTTFPIPASPINVPSQAIGSGFDYTSNEFVANAFFDTFELARVVFNAPDTDVHTILLNVTYFMD